MDWRDLFVRLAGDDGAGPNPFGALAAGPVAPVLLQAGEGEQRFVGRHDRERLLGGAHLLPLVEAARRDDAAPAPERFAERGRRLHSLGADIDAAIPEGEVSIGIEYSMLNHDLRYLTLSEGG